MKAAAAPLLLALLSAACAAAPKPSDASLRIRANPKAIVEGTVRDAAGKPAAGLSVRGIPRGADIPWSPWATTDCDGHFRLTLFAPGGYSFLLGWKGVAVMTPNPQDPALTQIQVAPGQTVTGVELTFPGPEWLKITGQAPGDTPSCP